MAESFSTIMTGGPFLSQALDSPMRNDAVGSISNIVRISTSSNTRRNPSLSLSSVGERILSSLIRSSEGVPCTIDCIAVISRPRCGAPKKITDLTVGLIEAMIKVLVIEFVSHPELRTSTMIKVRAQINQYFLDHQTA